MNYLTPPETELVITLLERSGLPTADITAALLTHFIGAKDGNKLMGVIGLERFGSVGLLRSLAVDPDTRRAGLGAKLLKRLETLATSSGVTTLYLLTTDAHGYFERHGFTVVDREHAPDVIRQSQQFSRLCPESAVVMLKQLA